MAHEKNMVVSTVTLSKETPLSSMHTIYQKVLQGLYLPGQVQPGLSRALDMITAGAAFLPGLFEYCLTGLETNRLYYVLKSYIATQDEDEKYSLLADIEGDFLTSTKIRQIFQRIYNSKAIYHVNFVKSKHTTDYFAFLSKLFKALGYNGWVILFDEAELTGRMGKKTRLKAYENMAKFLKPERMEAVFSIFAFNASYVPDVIYAKREEENALESALSPETKSEIAAVLTKIITAPQLVPLDRAETLEILEKIQRYHGKAYGWEPKIDPETLFSVSEKHGYLLRTHIRTAVEFLDQLFQYGEAGDIRINELGQMTFEEDGSDLEDFAN